MKTIAQNNPDTFQIKLPDTFTYKERSWYLASTGYWAYYDLDGVRIKQIANNSGATVGTLIPAQLSTNVFHTVSILNDHGWASYAGLVLVYKVQ
jgi:hypothetical protein